MTWTLGEMRRFVLTHEVEVPCSICGKAVSFVPLLILSPEYNDLIRELQVCVVPEVAVMSKTCSCSLGLQLYDFMHMKALAEIERDFAAFLHAQPSASPVENRAANIEAVKVY